MRMIQNLGAIHPMPNSKYTKSYGIYECPFCGTHFRSMSRNIDTGHTKSCGCQQRLWAFNKCYKHGLKDTRIYNSWCAMKARCYNKKKWDYKYYGGKGVRVCDEWKNDFMAFYNWSMVNGYKDNLEPDRINSNGNYEPSNCRFSDRSIQMENTGLIRSNNTSGYRGVSRFDKKWMGYITWKGKRYYFGLFDTPEQAAQPYNNFVIEHKTAHPLNIIPNA